MSRFQIRNCENVEQHARYFYPQASSRDVHERFKPTWREAAIGTHDLGVDPAALADGKELHHIGDVFHLT